MQEIQVHIKLNSGSGFTKKLVGSATLEIGDQKRGKCYKQKENLKMKENLKTIRIKYTHIKEENNNKRVDEREKKPLQRNRGR
jgi:hypothetical protein